MLCPACDHPLVQTAKAEIPESVVAHTNRILTVPLLAKMLDIISTPSTRQDEPLSFDPDDFPVASEAATESNGSDFRMSAPRMLPGLAPITLTPEQSEEMVRLLDRRPPSSCDPDERNEPAVERVPDG